MAESPTVGLASLPGLKRMPALLARAVRLVWAADRRTFLTTAALQLLGGIGIAAQLLVANRALAAITSAGAGRGAIDAVLPELALLAAVVAGFGFAQAAQAGFRRLLTERFVRYFNHLMLDVAVAVDLESFESAAFYDRLQRARQHQMQTPLAVADCLPGIMSALIGAAGIALALAAIEPVLIPLAFAGYLPLWVVARRNSDEIYRFIFGQSAADRLRNHLAGAMTGRDQAAEVRAFDLGGFLLARWDRCYAERLDEVRGIVRRHIRRSLVGHGVTSLLQAAMLAVLVAFLLAGRLDIAGAATAAIALQQLAGRLQDIGRSAVDLYEAARYLEEFEALLALRPAAPPPVPVARPFERLDVVDLRFAYPDAERHAIDGVSFSIEAGEVVALVGENGSGKTTLAKLLAQLYRPTGGRITWDGEDTAGRHPRAWRANVAVIFQDFVRHRLTAAENIGVGNPSRMGDLEAVRAAARQAGADRFLSEMSGGYSTILTKEFDGGADLSVGQWQRVALARGFFRDAPFLILDEPTAALDPKAESELFEAIRELSGTRTVLFISHRFSSARSADRILVLHEGRLVEQGAHRQLMAKGGRYAEMFTIQASAYVDGSGVSGAP